MATTKPFGDMTQQEREAYLTELCASLELNPFTRPFEFLLLNNKWTVYATKSCASQLREKHNITAQITYSGALKLDDKTTIQDVYVVHVRVFNAADGVSEAASEWHSITQPKGRFTDEVGSVGIKNLAGDVLANAIMRAVTKATRRATLAHCGVGFVDESEVDSIPGAVRPDDVEPGPTKIAPK